MSTEESVVPGAILGEIPTLTPGKGTYVNDHIIHASVLGIKIVTTEEDGTKTVSVERLRPEPEVPVIGNVVLCRVTKINMRMAYVDIIAIENGNVFRQPIPGVIKSRDLRSFDQDTVEVYNCCRPGDILRTIVVSLGDSRSYFLSMARVDLGVVAAKGRGGVPMIPLSWEVMQCPITRVREYRKVAKMTPDTKPIKAEGAPTVTTAGDDMPAPMEDVPAAAK